MNKKDIMYLAMQQKYLKLVELSMTRNLFIYDAKADNYFEDESFQKQLRIMDADIEDHFEEYMSLKAELDANS